MYTSIQHNLRTSGINNMVNNAVKHSNGAAGYIHIKFRRIRSYSIDPMDSDSKYTASGWILGDHVYVRLAALLSNRQVAFSWKLNALRHWSCLNQYATSPRTSSMSTTCLVHLVVTQWLLLR